MFMYIFHHLSALCKMATADTDLGVHHHNFALKREKKLETSFQSHKPILALI